MEKSDAQIADAKKHLDIAHHMLTITYPAVQDNRLLLSIIENLQKAQEAAITAFLDHERQYKRVPPFHTSFDAKLATLKFKCPDPPVDDEDFRAIQQINEVIQNHKDSPFEFSRNDKFVICSGHQDFRSISKENTKDFLQSTRRILQKVQQRIDEDDV